MCEYDECMLDSKSEQKRNQDNKNDVNHEV